MLRKTAQLVLPEHIPHAEFQRLIDDMIETMHEYIGVGLAAPQVHVSRQLAVLQVDKHPRYPDVSPVPLTVLINPRLSVLSEQRGELWEGCLSIPGLRGMVRRHTAVRVQALDRHGRPLDFVAKDFHARVIEHEYDHLQGKVYVDRMDSLHTLSHLDEWQRYWLPTDTAD